MRAILSILLLVLAVSCAGPSVRVASGTAVQVSFFSQDTHLTIVNDSHLLGLGIEGDNPEQRRLNYSSLETAAPFVKVASDGEMLGLLQALDGVGLRAPMRTAGTAPRGTGFGMALEIDEGGKFTHAVSHSSMPASQRTELVECVKTFNAVYNALPQYQSVPEEMGKSMLQDMRNTGAGR